MKADREKLVQELKAWRLNQPYMTSEEAREQFERVRRNVQSRWANASGSNAASSSVGHVGKVVYSHPSGCEAVSLAEEPSAAHIV